MKKSNAIAMSLSVLFTGLTVGIGTWAYRWWDSKDGTTNQGEVPRFAICTEDAQHYTFEYDSNSQNLNGDKFVLSGPLKVQLSWAGTLSISCDPKDEHQWFGQIRFSKQDSSGINGIVPQTDPIDFAVDSRNITNDEVKFYSEINTPSSQVILDILGFMHIEPRRELSWISKQSRPEGSFELVYDWQNVEDRWHLVKSQFKSLGDQPFTIDPSTKTTLVFAKDPLVFTSLDGLWHYQLADRFETKTSLKVQPASRPVGEASLVVETIKSKKVVARHRLSQEESRERAMKVLYEQELGKRDADDVKQLVEAASETSWKDASRYLAALLALQPERASDFKHLLETQTRDQVPFQIVAANLAQMESPIGKEVLLEAAQEPESQEKDRAYMIQRLNLATSADPQAAATLEKIIEGSSSELVSISSEFALATLASKLERTNPEAVKEIYARHKERVESAQSTSPYLLASRLTAMGNFRLPQTAEDVGAYQNHENLLVRKSAMRALKYNPNPKAIQSLVSTTINSRVTDEKNEALKVIATLPVVDKVSLAAIAQVLRSSKVAVIRVNAINALAAHWDQDPGISGAIFRASRLDSDEKVRQAASKALLKRGVI